MPDMMFQALDLTGLNETAEQVRAIVQAAKSEIEAELDSLDYAQPDGIYPDMTVGAVIGADETSQWATRESTGTGSATVRSVQGAAVAWNQLVGSDTSSVTVPSGHKYLGIIGGTSAIATSDGTAVSVTGGTDQLFDLTAMFGSGNEPSTVAEFEQMYPEAYYPYSAPVLKPVQIAGIVSADAQGGELDAIEWTAQELWGITSAHTSTLRDELTADKVKHYIGVVDLGTLNWTYSTTYQTPYFTTPIADIGAEASTDRVMIAGYESKRGFWSTAGNDMCVALGGSGLNIANSNYTNAAAFKAAMQGVMCAFVLATPTTTPISPALPMTYKVQAGGSESIIVPDGEISAAPIITIAEPVNMSTELALIWAAIEALQGSRGSALGSVRSDSDVSSTEVKEAPTMDEKQVTERESEI